MEESESPTLLTMSYNQRDREKQVISVLDGLEGGTVDAQMADKWLQNEDDLCPQVIADSDDDGANSSCCLGEDDNIDN